jgi:acyl dehydratase
VDGTAYSTPNVLQTASISITSLVFSAPVTSGNTLLVFMHGIQYARRKWLGAAHQRSKQQHQRQRRECMAAYVQHFWNGQRRNYRLHSDCG